MNDCAIATGTWVRLLEEPGTTVGQIIGRYAREPREYVVQVAPGDVRVVLERDFEVVPETAGAS